MIDHLCNTIGSRRDLSLLRAWWAICSSTKKLQIQHHYGQAKSSIISGFRQVVTLFSQLPHKCVLDSGFYFNDVRLHTAHYSFTLLTHLLDQMSWFGQNVKAKPLKMKHTHFQNRGEILHHTLLFTSSKWKCRISKSYLYNFQILFWCKWCLFRQLFINQLFHLQLNTNTVRSRVWKWLTATFLNARYIKTTWE